MFEGITKRRLIFLAVLLIGGVGAVGQAYMLYHELVNCYPFKMMNYSFYERIAIIGVYVAPFNAVVCGLVIGLKRLWLVPIVPVTMCPLLFAVVFKTISVTRELNGAAQGDWNFDRTTPAIAAQEFYLYATELAIAGLIIGAIVSLLFSRLSNERKLA